MDGHNRGEQFQTADGSVYFEVEGTGPPVVIVPGGPGAGHAHYHPWFSHLASAWTVVYFDQLGTGRWDRLTDPGRYGVELYAGTIEQLMDHLALPAAHLIGISFGGVAATEMAARVPDRVLSLLLVSAQVDAHGWQAGNIDNVNAQVASQFPEVWRELLALRSAGVLSADDRYQRLLGPVAEMLEWASVDHAELSREPAYASDAATYFAFVGDDPEWTVAGALAGHTVLDRLLTRRPPTMIVAGRYDRMTTPALAERIARELALGDQSVHVFERSAHRPWAEEPRAFFDLADRFLRQSMGDQ